MSVFAHEARNLPRGGTLGARAIIILVALSVLSLVLTACGEKATTSTKSEKATASTPANVVGVKLGENGGKYFIKLDKNSAPAGNITFKIDNVGSMHHEMVIFKTDLDPGELPLNDEGKVDEDKVDVVGEAVYATPPRGEADHRIREERGVDYTIDLQPGKYVLLCNLGGHYKAGQYIAFTVEGKAGDSTEDAVEKATNETKVPEAKVEGTAVKVDLGESGSKFFLKVDKTSVPAGTTTFVIDNIGSMWHEFVIAKTDIAAGKLPVNDERKVDEEQINVIGEAVYATPLRGEPDHRFREERGANFTIELKPGNYVLFCNLAGHYTAGQYVAFTVK